MKEPNSPAKTTTTQRKELEEALVVARQTKFFFEEAVKQTERFWAHFRWISGLIGTAIVLAVGYQAYQNHVRLTDAVKTANDSMNAFLESAEERVQKLETKADEDVQDAIEKLYGGTVKSAIVKNAKDDSRTITGYTEHIVQTGNDIPYGIDLRISFRIRLGYEGSGTANILGYNVSADQELLDSIYENDSSVERDILTGGTFMVANNFTAVPSQLYSFGVTVERRIANCEIYESLMRRLEQKGKIGRIFVSPVLKEMTESSKFEFDVVIQQRTMTPCQELWDLGKEKAADAGASVKPALSPP